MFCIAIIRTDFSVFSAHVTGDRFVVTLERLIGLVLVAVSIEMLLRGIKTYVKQLAGA